MVTFDSVAQAIDHDCLCDLWKAFDLLDHQILLKWLNFWSA